MMVNVKKNILIFRYFVILLTFCSLFSCKTNKYYNYKVEGKKIGVTSEKGENKEIEAYIAPFRANITKELDSVLAYCPEILDKSIGKWQTTIGNLLATIVFELGNPVFEKREHKSIDFCLLNSGGIRSIIPQGNVTSRTAYEVMPFENSLYVVALKGSQIKEMGTYLLAEKKPHPLYGIQFYVDKNNLTVKRIEINGKPIDDEKIYYVATSDYLSNGGDNMTFFKESTEKYDLDYKIRNILIDYFKKVDTIPVLKDEKIIIE
jgi:2',3'-cyclic-nucleotide 2'-phosphodiesterase (5'-nucleotidase family)